MRHEYPYEYMADEEWAGHSDGLDAMDEMQKESDALAKDHGDEDESTAADNLRRFILESVV